MKFIKPIFLFCLSLVLTASFANTQVDDTIRVDTSLISVGVIAKDKTGKFVQGLSKEQFEVFDDAEQQEIAFFSTESAAVSFGIIYDLHPTTSERTKTILRSLKEFTNTLPAKDDFFNIVFNEHGSLNLNFVPTPEQVARHLSFDEKNEPHSLYDAVFLGAEKLSRRSNPKKTLIIISDGNDHDSHHSFGELSKTLKSFNVQIYAIILNEKEEWRFSDLLLDKYPRERRIDKSTLDSFALKDLSRASGGGVDSSMSKSSEALYEVYNRIAENMRRQYLISFYPNISSRKIHKLRIKVKPERGTGKVNLTYRKDYLAETQKQ